MTRFRLGCAFFLVTCLPIAFIAVQPSPDDAFYSEAALKKAKVVHPAVMNRHYAFADKGQVNASRYDINTITTAGRRDVLRRLLNSTVQALWERAGVKAVLTSGSALGYFRTHGRPGGARALAWDDDDDISIWIEDWAKLRRNGSYLFDAVQGRLKAEGVTFELNSKGSGHSIPKGASDDLVQGLSRNVSCGVCGRAAHPESGFFLDVFILKEGVGPLTRGPKFRGTRKGCWREAQGAEGLDPDTPGSGMVHMSGDWHMFGWDTVLRKDELFPLRKVQYEEVDVWVAAKPGALAFAEFGGTARWYNFQRTLFMYGSPDVCAVVGALVVVVVNCYSDLRGGQQEQVPGPAVAFSFCAATTLVLCLAGVLRSGFASCATFAVCVAIPLASAHRDNVEVGPEPEEGESFELIPLGVTEEDSPQPQENESWTQPSTRSSTKTRPRACTRDTRTWLVRIACFVLSIWAIWPMLAVIGYFYAYFSEVLAMWPCVQRGDKSVADEWRSWLNKTGVTTGYWP